MGHRPGGTRRDLLQPAARLLELGRRHLRPQRHEGLFILRGRDPRHRAHLRIRQLAPLERRLDHRQFAQAPRHTHSLPGRMRCKPRPPGQPLRAGQRPRQCPPVARIELAQLAQHPPGQRFDLRRDRRNGLPEPFELDPLPLVDLAHATLLSRAFRPPAGALAAGGGEGPDHEEHAELPHPGQAAAERVAGLEREVGLAGQLRSFAGTWFPPSRPTNAQCLRP